MKIHFLAAVLAIVAECEGTSLRESVSESMTAIIPKFGKWGVKVSCPKGYAMSKLCSSGRDADCGNGIWTMMYCTSDTKPMLDTRSTKLYQPMKWGQWQSCEADSIATTMCTSGRDKDCDYLDTGNQPFTLGCQKLMAPYKISTDQYTQKTYCCDYGKTCSCPAGYYMISVCTSGQSGDCESQGCKHKGRTYTGITCAKVVKEDPKEEEKWNFVGSWKYVGNTPMTYTYGVTFNEENGRTSETKETIKHDATVSLSESIKGSAGPVTATTTYGFSYSFGKEMETGESISLLYSISSSYQFECNPGEMTDTKNWLKEEYKKVTNGAYLPTSSLRFYKYQYHGYRGDSKLVEDTKCDFMLLLTGLQPQCPPSSCQDFPLCQTCCMGTEGGKQVYTACKPNQIKTSDLKSILA